MYILISNKNVLKGLHGHLKQLYNFIFALMIIINLLNLSLCWSFFPQLAAPKFIASTPKLTIDYY